MYKVLLVQPNNDKNASNSAASLQSAIRRDGRFTCRTADLSSFGNSMDADVDVILLNSFGQNVELTDKQKMDFTQWVEKGGVLICCNRSLNIICDVAGVNADIYKVDDAGVMEWISNGREELTGNLPGMSLNDSNYLINLDKNTEGIETLYESCWRMKRYPTVFTVAREQGLCIYLGAGLSESTWKSASFVKLVLRLAAFGCGFHTTKKQLNFGILGYGGEFRMGLLHSQWIDSVSGLRTVAVCDNDPLRIQAARQELPGLEGYYTDLDDMLKMKEVDVIVNILPHHLHAPLSMKCLLAGKHVICEKPFCLNLDEADKMIELAEEKNLMLSIFHNRRWDSDYLTIKEIIRQGLIGDIFHIEGSTGGFNHPGHSWRSDPDISGGIMYDFGSHFVDWILNLVDSPIEQILGDMQKRVWHSVGNADYGSAWLRFENGATANLEVSNISACKRPKWRILGTKGSIEIPVGGELIILVSNVKGIRQETRMKAYTSPVAGLSYYQNIAGHMFYGDALGVTAQDGKRVIGVLQTIHESWKQKKSLPPLVR